MTDQADPHEGERHDREQHDVRPGDVPPGDVLSHLQAAARELIAAGRGILDAADELVSDRIRLLSAIVGEPAGRAPGEKPPRPKVEKIDVERVDGNPEHGPSKEGT